MQRHLGARVRIGEALREILDAARERSDLSEQEAMRLAIAEQKAYRAERDAGSRHDNYWRATPPTATPERLRRSRDPRGSPRSGRGECRPGPTVVAALGQRRRGAERTLRSGTVFSWLIVCRPVAST